MTQMGLTKKLLKLMSIKQVIDPNNSYGYYLQQKTTTKIVPQEKNIIKYLKSRNKNLKQDKVGNLYLINVWTPLICAHMDTVGSAEAQKKLNRISIVEPWDVLKNNDLPPYDDIINQTTSNIIIGEDNIGADDKCGVAIAMELYETFGDKVSLLFTIGEETGGIGISGFDKTLLKQCTYAIIPDRKGGQDIIGSHNDYCTKEFEEHITGFLAEFWYSPAHGVWSDCDEISEHINCFNLSCGYYNAHSSNEYVNIDEFENCYNALVAMISDENSNVSMPKPEKYASDYSWYKLNRDYYPAPDLSSMEVEWDMLYVYKKVTLYGDNWPIELSPGDYWIGNHWDDTVYEDPFDIMD